jgi:hypothetical protein
MRLTHAAQRHGRYWQRRRQREGQERSAITRRHGRDGRQRRAMGLRLVRGRWRWRVGEVDGVPGLGIGLGVRGS